MNKIVVATKNKGKIREIVKYFSDLGVEVVSMEAFEPLPEAVEDGKTFADNALIKAKFYGEKIGLPCLADDSGLTVRELQGEPGVYSARYAGTHADDEANNAKLVRELQKLGLDKAHGSYICSMALYFPASGEVLTAEGICSGIIRTFPAGSEGFGYDPYFYLPEFDKTMAEISMDTKNSLSHRGKALKIMAEKYGDCHK